MASVHLVRRRRWFGWYNSPGSLHVAKTYATLAQSRTFDRHSRALNVDPSSIMELDGKYGPRYLGVYSGTRLPQTGHMAYLLTDYCDKLDSNSSELGSPVMVVKFPGHPTIEPNSDLPSDHFSEFDPFVVLLIIVNVVTAVLCGLTGDWYSFAMIVLGIVCNGVSCLVLGSGSLQVQFATASKHSLVPDDGLLIPSIPGQPLIILQVVNPGSSTFIIRVKIGIRFTSSDISQQL
ncbi:hypothetical protein BDZ97DRAFT_1844411 [Flammula alnicola]|nr:hypothetical protein BDZ97DRAFT_1844411 [Flammula alnicola]